MITPIRRNSSREADSSEHARFLAMLPSIRRQARLAFRNCRPEAQEELVAEVVGNAYGAFRQLIERGKADLAYPTPLTRYAVRQLRAGRCLGSQLNVNDVSSPYAQMAKGIIVERLEQFDPEEGAWREILIEDRRVGPAETASARIDVTAWLGSLGRRKRRIAETLARGETTGTVATMFGLSPGRVSQLRQELRRSWEVFQGTSVSA